MNDEQNISIVASPSDGIYHNEETGEFVDLDNIFGIESIKQLIYDADENVFYLLCNKFQEKLGVFMIRFNENDPYKHEFFIKWKNKLDIDDTSIAVTRSPDNKFKELIVTYKSIYLNTYTTYVLDISQADHWTMFRHESF